MHPYRTPAEPESDRTNEAPAAPPFDAYALVSFAAAFVVTLVAVGAISLLWGAEVAALFATLLAPSFVRLSIDELEP